MKNGNKIMSYLAGGFIFLTLFYPLIHNTLIYGLNYVSNAAGFTIGKKNVFLLGWKDAFFVALFPILLYSKNRLVSVLLAITIATSLYFRETLLIKELLYPFCATLTWAYYEKDFAAILSNHRKRIVLALSALTIGILSISYVEYSFRINKNITNSDFYIYEHMRIVNEIRCSKYYLLATLPSDDYNHCIEKSNLNSYKIKHNKGEYTALHTLFLPIGDSVIFSFILIYFFLALLFFRDNKTPFSRLEILLLVLITSSVFLTLNRVNSVLTIALIFATIFAGKNYFDGRIKKAVFMIIPMAVFLFRADYLLFSIFDRFTPSNIGHVTSITSFIGSRFNSQSTPQPSAPAPIASTPLPKLEKKPVNALPAATTPPVIAPTLSPEPAPSFIQKNWGRVFLIRANDALPIPLESNVLKIAHNYRVFGILLYTMIWFMIIKKMIFLTLKYRELHNYRMSILTVLLLGTAIFGYQLISPYIVSGYVVFFPFIALLYLTSGHIQIMKDKEAH